MPGTFIPVAESTGLIAEIGDWVIGEVAATLGSWHREGFSRRIAFNVSPRQLDRADFFARLRQTFADNNVPLSLVELEFTETAAMKANDAVVAEIAALTQRTVRASLSTISVPAIRTSPGFRSFRSIA